MVIVGDVGAGSWWVDRLGEGVVHGVDGKSRRQVHGDNIS